jgi:hypothetical protein
MSYFASICSVNTGMKIHDATTGYIIREVLEEINLINKICGLCDKLK